MGTDFRKGSQERLSLVFSKMRFLVSFFVFLATIVHASKRGLPFTHSADRLIELVDGEDLAELEDYGLDIWRIKDGVALARIPSSGDEYPDEVRFSLITALENYHYTELDVNIDDLIDQSFTKNTIDNDEWDYNVYHNLSEIWSWMDKMADDHPSRVTLDTMGQTVNGNELRVIKITPENDNNSPAIFVDCGIHAREWISHAWCQYLIHYLLDNPDNDPEIDTISNSLTWHIVPILNPDGYDYTWTNNRMWRKNRNMNADSPCVGVDLNRNYDAEWSGPGASDNPCSDAYYGPSVFSENESSSESNYMINAQNQTNNSLKMYLTFHSWSQLCIFPYAVYSKSPDNEKELYDLSEETANAIEKIYGTKFIYGQTVPTLYPAAGGSDDWAYDHAGDMDLVYTFELRDQGTYGFLLPEDQIMPTSFETMAGVKVMALHVIERFLGPQNP